MAEPNTQPGSIPEAIDALNQCVCDNKSAIGDVQTKLDAATKTVYRLEPNDNPGILNREWEGPEDAIPINQSTTAAGRAFRLAHDFSQATTVNTVVNDLRLNDTNNTAGLLDKQVLDTVIKVPAGGIWIRYTGGSEGYWAIEVGECCGPLVLKAELGYADREDNSQIVGPVFLPEGQHYLRMWNIDSGGTNSSHTDQYSLDGTTFTGALPAGVEFSLGKRIDECDSIPFCDDTPEGWSNCPTKDCEAAFPNNDNPNNQGGGLDEAAVQALIDATPHPDQEICTGDFVDVSSRTGWLHTWTPAYTANSGTVIDGWNQVGTAEVAPNCQTDITVNVALGNYYYTLENMWGRSWYDVRLLVNGTAVLTYTFQNYAYDDDRSTTNTNRDNDIRPLGSAHLSRANVPAGATITVEIQRRHSFAVGPAAGEPPYGRLISGLRAHFNVHYSPTQIVTGRV